MTAGTAYAVRLEGLGLYLSVDRRRAAAVERAARFASHAEAEQRDERRRLREWKDAA